jgi:hypothetical protein
MVISKIKSLFGQDEVQIDKEKYLVLFDAQAAEHVCDNYSDPKHRIKAKEIRSCIKSKAALMMREKKSIQILANFKGSVYQIPVFTHKNIIFIKSAYKCSNNTYRLIYNSYFP